MKTKTKARYKLLALVIGAVIFCAAFNVSAQPWEQTGWQNFRPVPIQLQDIGIFNAEVGDILFSESGATLVAINSKEALYLDFNLELGGNYMKVGRVDKTFMKLLDQLTITSNKKAYVETQFRIWRAEGVDVESLKIVWTNAYNMKSSEWLISYAVHTSTGSGIDLTQAINHDLISADFQSHGYSSVTVQLTNIADKNLAINAYIGMKLANGNGQNQNIGLGETVTIYLPAGMHKEFTMKSYCINAHKGVPATDDKLDAAGVVERGIAEPMLDAFKLGKVAAGESQQAVWSRSG